MKPVDWAAEYRFREQSSGKAVSIPEDIAVLGAGERAGHGDRMRAIAHIQQMEKNGYISRDEAERRAIHASIAEKKLALNVLISDLPAYTDERGWFATYDFSRKRYWMPVLLALMFLSAAVAVLPVSILSASGAFHSGAGRGLWIPALVLGIIGFITSACMIITKYNTRN